MLELGPVAALAMVAVALRWPLANARLRWTWWLGALFVAILSLTTVIVVKM